MTIKRILVATDGSADADRAMEFAAQMAKDVGAELVIAHVIGDHALPHEIFQQFTRAQQHWLSQQFEAISGDLLKRARDQVRKLGVQSVRLESRQGEVAQAILQIADDIAADAIVVGKRGAGRVKGLLLGSVSQKLVSLAPQVVIVVP